MNPRMASRESTAIESFTLSIAASGRHDGLYDLQWEIICLTRTVGDEKVTGEAEAGHAVTYGEVMAVLARALRIMRPE